MKVFDHSHTGYDSSFCVAGIGGGELCGAPSSVHQKFEIGDRVTMASMLYGNEQSLYLLSGVGEVIMVDTENHVEPRYSVKELLTDKVVRLQGFQLTKYLPPIKREDPDLPSPPELKPVSSLADFLNEHTTYWSDYDDCGALVCKCGRFTGIDARDVSGDISQDEYDRQWGVHIAEELTQWMAEQIMQLDI